MTLSARIADLRRYHAHYAASELTWRPDPTGRLKNPFTGLRIAAERCIRKLEAECSSSKQQHYGSSTTAETLGS